ncbi:hypothetical protein BKA58DRAFT_458764 [Alternaria rosae]|uniref:uncharacterized protein n=1 Tax=Alternaria rosae TaxID=1187941 RepID=UPI001E8D34A8|nr:uncharacterized protein BKA58DRAFT_458764 [Alternaria rosae]KAH6868133.1 hypothetical protein BKA58DRAFT_458764 [Alternaria rosae]
MYTTPLQREAGTSSAKSVLKSITFVLAGRTTLSEHCPTEQIEVGYAVAERSPYLRIYLPQHVRDDRPLLPIQLGDIDPAGFKLYIEWLTTGIVKFSDKRCLQLDSCIDLIYAHIVGSAFSQRNFQDYIIDRLAHVLDPAQTFDQKVLELLYLEKHASTLLRKFVTDRMFAYDRRMLGMLRNSVEDVVTGTSNVKGCEYHMHDEEFCYKHGRVSGLGESEKKNEAGEKQWSIDDDPELNSTAAQYLSKKITPLRMDKSSKDLATKDRSLTEKRRHQHDSFASQPKELSLHIMSNRDIYHQGLTLRSRNLRSPRLSTRSLTPNIDLDKPLPPTPEAVETPSTQDLVLECLGRLPPAAEQISTQDLVDACLARTYFHPLRPITPSDNDENLHQVKPSTSLATPKTSSSLKSSTFTSKSRLSSPLDFIPPSLRPESPLQYTYPTRNPTFAPLSQAHRTTPKPRSQTASPNKFHTTSSLAPYPPRPHTPASRDTSSPSSSPSPFPFASPSPSPPPLFQIPYYISPSSPSLPHFAPLIVRKPAPPRGVDWLEQ